MTMQKKKKKMVETRGETERERDSWKSKTRVSPVTRPHCYKRIACV